MKRLLLSAALAAVALALVACAGPRAFTRGQYGDPQEISMLDDQWNQNDMQLVAKKVVSSLEGWIDQTRPPEKPVVILGMPENKTSEHIDMQALYDQVRTALVQSGRFTFVDESARPEIAKEYEYQGSGYVDPSKAKGPGRQTAPEFFLKGRVTSTVQQVGNDKVVYYKATFRLSNIETAEIVWTDEKEIAKHFKKKSIGF